MAANAPGTNQSATAGVKNAVRCHDALRLRLRLVFALDGCHPGRPYRHADPQLKASLQLQFAHRARYGRDTLTADGPMNYFDGPTRVSLGGLGMTQLWAVPASAPRFDSVTPASTAAFSANAELYLR